MHYKLLQWKQTPCISIPVLNGYKSWNPRKPANPTIMMMGASNLIETIAGVNWSPAKSIMISGANEMIPKLLGTEMNNIYCNEILRYLGSITFPVGLDKAVNI
jgi:hypothetical protein